MGLGVSFKLAPGVRVRASTRGVRTSIGPRAARVHVGGGRTRISTGVGPLTLSSSVGGGARRPARRAASGTSRPRQPTVAQLQAQARAVERAQQVADVAALERALTTLHRQEFRASTRQVVAVPSPPSADDLDGIRRELFRTATTGVPLWKRAERKEAKGWAEQNAPGEAQRRYTGQLVATQYEQASLDEAWDALRTHDPLTVIEAVDEAFADNASDSTCVDAGTDPDTGARYVTAVVTYGSIDLVPELRPDVTPGGKPTLKKRTKTDRNALYAAAMASTVLATAKEALAVAVAASEVRVLVVRPAAGGGVEPVYGGTFPREALTSVSWPAINPLTMAQHADAAEMSFKGSTREVVAINMPPDTPTGDLLNAWSRA